ncbi:Hypothetical predicted protein [Xyrichtys novacula]|uniref:Uncharacterized protein n=1 Tax=Xyrichtys novacula TaxID=13765 RepID=A0AAV1HE02_XYRNO|nr:Hypothetical predicted protein [Xyrichtys novacula]
MERLLSAFSGAGVTHLCPLRLKVQGPGHRAAPTFGELSSCFAKSLARVFSLTTVKRRAVLQSRDVSIQLFALPVFLLALWAHSPSSLSGLRQDFGEQPRLDVALRDVV